jgi:ribonuclease VapC
VALMVIDTSAIVAILFDEPDQRRYDEAIEAAGVRLLSAVTRVELSFVIEGRKREAGRERLERFFRLTGTEIVAVTLQQAEIAIDAFRRFGRGRHRAALNIGDCFSYALAVATDDTLLFKGDDFTHTDIRPALPPAAAAP